jgi:subtilase family serine protease
VGSIFEVKASVATPAYVASGVQVQPTLLPSGLTLLAAQTMRHDGVPMAFHIEADTLTLGNLVPTHSRPVSYFFRADTPGAKTFSVRAWSENGGEVVASTSFQVQPLTVDLVQTAMGTNPGTPIAAPGTTFSVTDTVHNLGPGTSTSSRTRYYLSLDAVRGAGDTLLTGTHSVPSLAAGASHTATVKVTIPAGIALDAYFLLACADDQSTVVESDEGNNCAVSPGATVTVTRPDLVVNTISAPPATAKRGGKFPVTDTTHNPGAVAAESSKTRYYLSLDGVKSTGDRLLGGSRSVAALAPGASRSGTVTVTVPTATPLDTYFVLACADDVSQRVELDETNNCTASGTTVTVMP